MPTLYYRIDDTDAHHEFDRSLTIGRGSDSDLVIRGVSGVSRRHAAIRRAGSTYLVEDVRSRNGTRIERAGASIEVDQATPLEPGDTIILGELRVRFEVAAAERGDGADRGATYVPAVTRVDADRSGPRTVAPPPDAVPAESAGGPRWLPIVGGAIAAGAAAATAVAVIARVL